MNPFFDDLGRRWVEAARRRGARIDTPSLDSRVAEELLELARVAAHTRERRFAPLSCYLAGVASERLRGAMPGADDATIADYIKELRNELELEAPPTP